MQPRDSRPTIYLSSTYRDLRQHRTAVAQALRKAGYVPVGMEDYIAEGQRPLARCLEDVRACDVYVGIIGLRYGKIPSPAGLVGVPPLQGTTPGKTSFTEYEYRQALAAGKPVLMFLLAENTQWLPTEQDSHNEENDFGRQIKNFRAAISDAHTTLSFTDPHHLATQVITSLTRHLGLPSPVPPPPVENPLALRDNLPSPTCLYLVGREKQRERIRQLLRLNTPVICLDGADGIGKTSMANAAGYDYRSDVAGGEAPHYVAWVAVSREADKSTTLDDVLNLVARLADFKSLTQRSLAENEEKLSAVTTILKEQKFLLIVDNFDDIQHQQLRQWLLQIPYPSHVLLVMRSVAAQRLPEQYPHVPLDVLDISQISQHIKFQALLLDIRELADDSAAPEALRELAEYSKGNPWVAELAMRTLKGRLQEQAFGEALKSVTHSAELQGTQIYALHRKLWQDLPAGARTVLCTTPLFISTAPIRQDALLAVSGLTQAEFTLAQQQLWPLLKPDADATTFGVEADTRSFAQEELQKLPVLEQAARRRWAEFYLQFVARAVVRQEPEVLYWRGLVSDSMEQLDQEWAAIREVLHWADQPERDHLLLPLMLLLTHYMDSRLLNKERLVFAGKAVQAARRLCLPYEEGLLRIDALGWTYFEEACPVKAHEEIARGLEIIRPFGESSRAAWELTQLGLAWQARVKMELALLDISKADSPILHREAVELIEKALRVDCSPWIRYRIFKAAGDIAFRAELLLQQGEESHDALAFYLQAETEIAKYGGEGASYQIAPRIGLAYLRKNDLPQARAYFDRLCQDEHMPIIGKLYGKYGKALVKNQQGLHKKASRKIRYLHKELLRHTTSNQLLNLVTSFGSKPPQARP